MVSQVHYVPLGFGRAQMVRPLLAGTFTPGRIVLLVPEHVDADTRLVVATETFLKESAGLEVQVRQVETADLAGVVATAYDDIVEELTAGNEVCLNTASPYWSLSSGYTLGATYVLAEWPGATDREPAGHLNAPRDHVALYYTEPDRYLTGDLIEVAQTMADFRDRFEDIYRVARDLRADVENDKRTIDGTIRLLETRGARHAGLEQVRRLIQATGLDDTDGSVAEALVNIIDGIEAVTDGIDTLADERHRETIDRLPLPGPLADVVTGLTEVSMRPDRETDEVTPKDLLTYFDGRLENVNRVLERVEIQYEDLQRALGEEGIAFDDLLTDLEHGSIAAGVRESNGQQHSDYPGPLQFDLTPFRRALLYVLAVDGATDSIRELATRLVRHALDIAMRSGIDMPEHSGVAALREGRDEAATELRDRIHDTLLTKVQYNVSSLETAGFVRKGKAGQKTSVRLTPAGELYTVTQSFDSAWRRAAFEDLCETLAEVLADDGSRGGVDA